MPTRRRSPTSATAPSPVAVAAAPDEPLPLADVFISYSRHDAAIATRLAETLRVEGFEVWFDQAIRAGDDWERTLRGVLAHAKAVLVLWSERSVQSRWVRLEAELALQTRRLVPAKIDGCTLPEPFAAVEAALLPAWDGGAHPELQVLLAGLARLAPPSRVDSVRPGFDSSFLGTEIALPGVPGVADEFRYLHFSVVMNPARRLAWYSAANLSRREFDVERGDRWMADPMLPMAFQPNHEHYRGTGFDRGHLTRSRAVSWGPERQASVANRQAFFFTNTAPQHPLMNQRWWLAVEKWEEALLEHEHDRLIVFSGPALAPDDPVHRDVEQLIGRVRTRENFRLPRAFWKLIVAPATRGRLATAAFWLDQEELLASRPAQPVVAAWRVDIATLAARTGLVFDEALRRGQALPDREGRSG